MESIFNIYKIIVNKTVHDIDLKVEPVCDVICFNPNLLISEESEELPENIDKKQKNHTHYTYE